MVESTQVAKQFDPMACNDKNLLIKTALELQKQIEKKERLLDQEREIQREFNASLKMKANAAAASETN